MDSLNIARNEILERLRKGRHQHEVFDVVEPNFDVNVFPVPGNLIDTFVDELQTISGKVFVGHSNLELVEKLIQLMSERNVLSLYCVDSELKEVLSGVGLTSHPVDFNHMEMAITRCECLVARTGSVVVSSAHESGRQLNVFPPIHVVWANANQLVPFVDDAIEVVKQRYPNGLPSQVTVITGASRTADIEKTLVMGAHGPKELIVLLNVS